MKFCLWLLKKLLQTIGMMSVLPFLMVFLIILTAIGSIINLHEQFLKEQKHG